ncbi:helix-turn-helix domain-containing protein, partial [Enterococcus faecalis]
ALFKETIFLIIRSVLLNKQIPVKILLHSSINQIQENWLAKEINNYWDVPLKFVNHIQEVPDLVITEKNNPLFHASK